MSKKLYSNTNLQYRASIFDTHTLLINFLILDVMHSLVHLFDIDCCKGQHFTHKTITGFIEEERSKRGLNNVGVQIISIVEKKSNANSILMLKILKNGKLFVHLSIHLVSKRKDPSKDGMIHIMKDIYTVKRTCRNTDKYYALIRVEQPNPKSLRFSIAWGYDTPDSPLASTYDIEVQQEMDVIITVLNKIFDADNEEYFVGSNEMRVMLPIQNKTNILLNNMNANPNIATRKNVGKKINFMNMSQLRKLNKNPKKFSFKSRRRP